ncbi:MAG: hypothetical protein JNK87_11155 [Bryobacterales bacterium]|nr:hypothetical protein [Bryobacterales bacterium]
MRALYLLLIAAASALPAEDATEVTSLHWLTGCWEMTTPRGLVEETWTRPSGGTLLMMGRTIRDDRTIFSEFVRISVEAGKLTYTARIGTPGMTAFPLLERTPDSLTFENKSHDFPQRIIYRRSATGLFARVEGEVKGKTGAQEFHYHTCR